MKQVISIVCGLFVLAGAVAVAFDGASKPNGYAPVLVTARGAVAGVTFPTAVASNANLRSIIISRPQAAATNVVFSLSTVASATLCTAGSNLVTFAVGTAGASTNGGIQWPVVLKVQDYGCGPFYLNAPTGEVFCITTTSYSGGNNE